jgi:hypothetical protein
LLKYSSLAAFTLKLALLWRRTFFPVGAAIRPTVEVAPNVEAMSTCAAGVTLAWENNWSKHITHNLTISQAGTNKSTLWPNNRTQHPLPSLHVLRYQYQTKLHGRLNTAAYIRYLWCKWKGHTHTHWRTWPQNFKFRCYSHTPAILLTSNNNLMVA